MSETVQEYEALILTIRVVLRMKYLIQETVGRQPEKGGAYFGLEAPP